MFCFLCVTRGNRDENGNDAMRYASFEIEHSIKKFSVPITRPVFKVSLNSFILFFKEFNPVNWFSLINYKR